MQDNIDEQARSQPERPSDSESPPERTVAVLALGCKANQEEIECLLSRLGESRYRVVPFGQPADWVVVNTCTVTAAGDSDSRQMIRRAVRGKGDGRVVVTGCLAQREPRTVALEGVDWVIGNAEKPLLADWILSGGPPAEGSLLQAPAATPPAHPAHPTGGAAIANVPRPVAARIRVGADPTVSGFASYGVSRAGRRTRATLKIQDGCDEHCTFCVIPSVRGTSRSRPRREVIEQARILVASGYREIALTGINSALWGMDLPGGERLPDLLEAFESVEGLERLRLNSLEPQYVLLDWIDRMAALRKLCPHYHLPLQSGDPAVLRRMNRRYAPEAYAEVVRAIRERTPGAAVGCDLLVGFPGETAEEFERTFDFVAEVAPAYVHVFSYSERPGTPALRMREEVSPETRRERSARVRALDRDLRRRFALSQIGTVAAVLPETEAGDGHWQGLTGNYLRVRYRGDALHPGGKLPEVRLESLEAEGILLGSLTHAAAKAGKERVR